MPCCEPSGSQRYHDRAQHNHGSPVQSATTPFPCPSLHLRETDSDSTLSGLQGGHEDGAAPVPGGPTSSTPDGARAPSRVNFSGALSTSCGAPDE